MDEKGWWNREDGKSRVSGCSRGENNDENRLKKYKRNVRNDKELKEDGKNNSFRINREITRKKLLIYPIYNSENEIKKRCRGKEWNQIREY